MGMPFPLSLSGRLFNCLGPLLYPAWIRSVLEMVGWLIPDGPVLDVGGGTGTMGKIVARPRELPVWVADPAMGMIRHGKGIRAVLARTPGLPFRGRPFAAVCIGEALHHFQDPEAALDEISTLLQPEGFLVIYDFDPSTVTGKILQMGERLFGEPGHFFPPDDLAGRLRSRGFHVRVYARNFRFVLIGSFASSHIFEEVAP